jgi:hypothetical protein
MKMSFSSSVNLCLHSPPSRKNWVSREREVPSSNRLELQDPGVLRDRPLDVLGRALGHLGLDLDGDPQLFLRPGGRFGGAPSG